jgi:hypothetical protein
VTRARRARRARLRASRPVAARAASRTRFGTSSRRVSIKARREACFTRFAFSRVLFFHAFCFFIIGFGSSRFRSFVKISKKKKKKKNGTLGISFLQRTNLVPGASVTKGETKSMNP